MYNNKCLCLVLVLLLSGCGRSDLAPVAIKVDENGDIVGQENLGPGEPTFGTTEPIASNPTVYVVKEGETLFDIANRFNQDPMVLARVNGIAYPYKVYAGQRLRISGSFSAEEVAAASPVVESEPPVSHESEKKSEKDDDNETSSNIDNDFSAMLAAVSGSGAAVATSSTNKNASKGSSFSEQEEGLSKPKIQPKSEPKKTEVQKESPKEEPKEEPKKGSKANVKATSGWSAPVNGEIISGYGSGADAESYDGIDIRAAAGTPVKAASGGRVIFADDGDQLSSSLGKTVLIDHGNNVVSSYSHLDSIKVKNGDRVAGGHVIGTVGKTGGVSEPQLHFEITEGENAAPVNPSKYVKF